MGMTAAILYGFLSLTIAVIAVSTLRKLPFVSVLSGLTTNVFLVLSAHNWRLALIDSGKNTAWLGFERYPLVLILYIVLVLTGAVCVVIGLIRLFRKHGKKLIG